MFKSTRSYHFSHINQSLRFLIFSFLGTIRVSGNNLGRFLGIFPAFLTPSHTRFFRVLPNRPLYMFAPASGQSERSGSSFLLSSETGDTVLSTHLSKEETC